MPTFSGAVPGSGCWEPTTAVDHAITNANTMKGFICFPPLAPQVERRTGVASQRIGIRLHSTAILQIGRQVGEALRTAEVDKSKLRRSVVEAFTLLCGSTGGAVPADPALLLVFWGIGRKRAVGPT